MIAKDLFVHKHHLVLKKISIDYTVNYQYNQFHMLKITYKINIKKKKK